MQAIGKKHTFAVAIFIIFGLWFFLLRSTSLGGPATYVIVYGHSMEPTMHTGDLALSLKQDNYSVGEVAAYQVDAGDTQGYRVPESGGIVIHRIIGGNEQDGFIMQGDNNPYIDPWEPTPDQIVGKAVFFIPRLGLLVSFLQDPSRLAIAVGLIFLYMTLAGSILSWKAYNARERRKRRRERAAQRQAGLASWLS